MLSVDRLNRELKESVESQMASLPLGDTTTSVADSKDAMVEEQVIENLQHQLQMALQV